MLDPVGKKWLTPGLKKYFCIPTLDPNSANKSLSLSEDKCTVTVKDTDLPYSDHPDRFDSCLQVLCSTGLKGRWYWEVVWEERMHSWEIDVAVSYRGIGRKGGSGVSGFGRNDKSWCLKISRSGFIVIHEDRQTRLSPTSYDTDRVAVYLDHAAGFLTFYKMKHKQLVHLHTFTSTFTEPLYAGFGFGSWSSGVTVSFGL
ncbi:stonustoxin subunit beta-like [Boleophthalmus pectinirostris]|uniref:stonustoxin subunit beta-like n=1 Tax=Boleophthalmus pectinirostris TaxID=150288 RepID=UPI00242E0CC0|nr:stonustoxin subunit beta-like [Boleophthalmus pectinirostris]